MKRKEIRCSEGFVVIQKINNKKSKMKGTIARIVSDRGFGFITPEDGSKDLFFHAKDTVDVEFDDLREGDVVNFEVVDGPKGPAASQVTRPSA